MKLFSRRKFPNRLGMPLLGIWLVAWGILALHLLNIPRSDVIAGWVILSDRQLLDQTKPPRWTILRDRWVGHSS